MNKAPEFCSVPSVALLGIDCDIIDSICSKNTLAHKAATSTTMTELHLQQNYGTLDAESKLAVFLETPSTHSTTSPDNVSPVPQAEPKVASILSNTIEPKDSELQHLFAENVAAKIWRVAQRDLINNVIRPVYFMRVINDLHGHLGPPNRIP